MAVVGLSDAGGETNDHWGGSGAKIIEEARTASVQFTGSYLMKLRRRWSSRRYQRAGL